MRGKLQGSGRQGVKKQKTTKLKNKRLKYFQVEEFHKVEGSPYRTLMNHILGLYPFSCVITCPNQ